MSDDDIEIMLTAAHEIKELMYKAWLEGYGCGKCKKIDPADLWEVFSEWYGDGK